MRADRRPAQGGRNRAVGGGSTTAPGLRDWVSGAWDGPAGPVLSGGVRPAVRICTAAGRLEPPRGQLTVLAENGVQLLDLFGVDGLAAGGQEAPVNGVYLLAVDAFQPTETE